ncbi:MAG: hypothetical protein JSS79_15490 [Bacteroidetes bacterium]|nr:hypothetical protein [Bacteroidota bacterium]
MNISPCIKKITTLAIGSLICLSALLFSNGCSEHHEDPCKALSATSADFSIMEYHGYAYPLNKLWKYYPSDTVSSLYIQFVAKDSTADSYEWHIGTGVYSKRSVSLSFPNTIVGQSVPITLILSKKPNLNCFPNNRGVDTLTKRVYFLDDCVSPLVKGKFNGYNTNAPKDTFSITIDLCKYNQFNIRGTNMTSLFRDRDCPTIFYSNAVIGYRELYFSSDGSLCGSSGIGGTAMIGPGKDQITVDYYYYPTIDLTTPVQRKFIGKRVN